MKEMIDRRSVLKAAATLGLSAAAPGAVSAREARPVPADALGMLYDATLCIGCKACMTACRAANNLEYEDESALHDAPSSLNGNTKNIIKLFRDGERISYMKSQCMHCVDPGCVSACILGAFQKREYGIVSWDEKRCIGCRYCQIACPYNVPKFEWASPRPKIVKCELCRHRIAEGLEPACCEVCPREAVIFGPRKELLAEAHRRLAEAPERYASRVFGERDGGGTQVLYLAAADVSFAELGLPELGEEGVPDLSETVQHGIYKGFIGPVALYALLGAAVWRQRRINGIGEEVNS
jgi:Fe-S-cluster-containing dehydrogenase component